MTGSRIAATVILLCIIICLLPFTASAEETSYFNYLSLKDGTLEITGLTETYRENIKGKKINLTIPSQIGNKKVTSIGYGAFRDIGALESVVISEGIKFIQKWAFGGCSYIKSVSIPSSVENIGNWAFSWDYKLSNITVDKNSKHFISVNSVLYNKDITELIHYPCGITAKEYVLPKSVNEIRVGAMVVCRNLTGIKVQDGNKDFYSKDGVLLSQTQNALVQYPIGNKAVAYNVPENIKKINGWAFDAASNLKSITLPNTLIELCYRSLSYTSISEIIIPENVELIEEDAFLGCDKLRKATFLGNAPETFGYPIFIDIPDLSVIYDKNTSGWENVYWLGGLFIINDESPIIEAYAEPAPVIEENNIKEEVFEKIDFTDTKKLIKFEDATVESRIRDIVKKEYPEKITLGDMLKVKAFIYDFNYGYKDNQIKKISDLRYCRDLEIIDITNQEDLVSISALKNLMKLREVSLHNCGVKDISALSSHSELQSVWLNGTPVKDASMVLCLPKLKFFNAFWGTDITDISALKNNSVLESFHIGNTGLSDISVLKDMKSLKNLSIENTQVSINQVQNVVKTLNLVSLDLVGLNLGDDIFDSIKHMRNLKQLDLSYNNISSIKELKNFTKLSDLRFVGNKIKDISAVKYLVNLTYCLDLRENQITNINALKDVSPELSIYLDDNDIKDWSPVDHVAYVDGRDWADFTYILNNNNFTAAITGYTGIGGTVKIPENIKGCYTVTSINKYAFYNNGNITGVVIPETVVKICDSAFRRCNSITSVKIPDNVTEIELYAFESCKNLKQVILGKGLATVGESVFRNCINLTSVSLPEGLKCVDLYAFENCNKLTKIFIPAKVTKIGEAAFMNCKSLLKAEFAGNAPATTGSDIFKNTKKDFTIYYKSGASGWTSPLWKGYKTKTIKQATLSPETETSAPRKQYSDDEVIQHLMVLKDTVNSILKEYHDDGNSCSTAELFDMDLDGMPELVLHAGGSGERWMSFIDLRGDVPKDIEEDYQWEYKMHLFENEETGKRYVVFQRNWRNYTQNSIEYKTYYGIVLYNDEGNIYSLHKGGPDYIETQSIPQLPDDKLIKFRDYKIDLHDTENPGEILIEGYINTIKTSEKAE